jgi:D-aminopeptidase
MPHGRREVVLDIARIDAIFAGLDSCRLPGAAIGIAIDGKPVYRKGFGLASMELPLVLSPSMRMRIGSTTKHFTALACMLLCEDGKAGIDDPLGQYLPELHPVCQRVSLRQLMGNTSGLRDACDIKVHFSGLETPPVATADIVSFYREIDDVNAEPGAAWIYNNGGWVLLSAVIERIAGRELEEILRTRIFEPVGMYDTLLRRWDTDFVPNSATAHSMSRSGAFQKSYYGHDYAGAGAIVSTVDDMLRWLAHMDAPVIGSVATWNAMRAPQTLTNGSSTGYGLGLIRDHYRGLATLSHAGTWTGANAQMLKVPAAHLDIVVMVNRGDFWAPLLVESVLDACIPGLKEVDTPERPIATGLVRSPATGRVIRLHGVSGQQIASIDGLDMPVESDSDGVFWPAGIVRYIKQSITLRGDPSRPGSIRFSDFGNPDELILLEPTSEAADAGAIGGRYRSDSTGTDAEITESGQDIRMRTTGRFGCAEFILERLAQDLWRARSTGSRPYGGILSFDRPRAAFDFSNTQTRSLRFRRCA